MKNKKYLIITASVLIVITILIFIFILIRKGKLQEELPEANVDFEKMENEFNNLFNNEENDYVKTRYKVVDEKTGVFMFNATIPYIDLDTEGANKINKNIDEIFIKKILTIGSESTTYSILEMDYATEINDNILSLMIKCVLKEGNSPQRTIIKTYNYNLENDKIIELTDLISKQKQTEIQEKINNKIEKEIKREEAIIKQGYNTYRRDIESQIYNIKNETDFYVGKEKILYIIYSYGNNNYTSEIDLILDKID